MKYIEKLGFFRLVSLLRFHINRIMFKSGPFAAACVFCISGILQPTTVEFLTINGAFNKTTMLIVLPNYLGMSCAILTKCEVLFTTIRYVVWWDMILLGMIDILSQGFCLLGLVCAGPSIYIIIYSSTTVWAALWSYYLLKKKLISQQWLGVMLVVFGLSLTALRSAGSDNSVSVTHSTSSNHNNSSKIFSNIKIDDETVGAILILCGSCFHALVWVLIEKWTKQSRSTQSQSAVNTNDCRNSSSGAPAPELICSIMGIIGSIFFISWQIIYTIPRWNTLVLYPIREHEGSVTYVCLAFVFLGFLGFVHATSFYQLLGYIGSVGTGVMKGVQSIAVIVLSHWAFCEVQQSQCFTTYKGFSLVIVLIGVICYSTNISTEAESAKSKHVYEAIEEDDDDKKPSCKNYTQV